MSLLWNRVRFRVHLGAGMLAACEVRGHGRRRVVVRKALLPIAPGERAGALQSLREWAAPGAGAPIEWVLGLSDVRYLLVPWSNGLADESLRDTVAATLFEQRFREDAAAYALRFAEPRFGRPQLAAFVALPLLADIAAQAREARLRLASVAPAVATVWGRFGPMLAKEEGVVHLVDGDRQAVVRHEHGHPVDVALRPFDGPRDACTLNAPCGPGTRRCFSSAAPTAGAAPSSPELRLTDGEGFDATGDAAYAFALCGVF